MQEWLATIVAVLISTTGALVSVTISRRAAREERLSAAEELTRKFREPILNSAYNLQTRIYNMVELDFFGRFLGADSTDSEREYAILHTMYVFAQYFCWVGILRQEAQYLDVRNEGINRAVAARLETIADTFSDSIGIQEKCFRLFRGEQRALGEVMLVPVDAPTPGAPRRECLGYASFVRSLEDKQMARWFQRLREDIAEFTTNPANRDGRLRLIHTQLMDIIDILDPDAHRVPMRLRNRITSRSS
jgi:hypothetical protein